MAKQIRFPFLIHSKKEHREFHQLARQQGLSLTKLIRSLLRREVEAQNEAGHDSSGR